MTFGDEDLKSALSGVGTVPVIFGAVSTRGYLDIEHEDVFDPGGVLRSQVKRITLLVQDGTLPDVTTDSLLTVDEVDYRVRQSDVVDDGKMLLLTLVKA